MLGFTPLSSAPLSDLGAGATYTLTVEAGVYSITGNTIALSWSGGSTYYIAVETGSYSVTGSEIGLTHTYNLPVTAGSYEITGNSIGLTHTYKLSVEAGSYAITGSTITLQRTYRLVVTAGIYTITGQALTVQYQASEVFTWNILIRIYVAQAEGNVVTTTRSLTADGTPIKLRSWEYDEAEQDIYGRLNAELANLSQRSLLTSTAAINFSVNGETLIDTGRLEKKNYQISRQGIGPADRVSFTAAPEMEVRLNTVPATPLVLYDPEKHTVTADDFQGIYDTENNYTAPTVTSVAELSFYEILQRVMVDICGFADYVTNIDDFPVPLLEFPAGVSYMNTIGSIIGMFEAIVTSYDEGSGLILSIQDGTAGLPAGSPSPRSITTSHTEQIGVATELERVESLFIDVTKDRFYYDTFTDRAPEIETINEGQQGLYSSQYTSTTITSYYRDFYRNSQPTTPVKTELRRQTTSVQLIPDAIVFLTTDELTYFDRWGRPYQRRKTTNARVPNPFLSFTIGLTEIETEDEYITYKMHPYEPRTYYTARREINKGGVIYIDGDNPQLGTSYARDVINAYRSGNVVDTMTGVYGKISQFIEVITPRKNKRLKVSNHEIDFTPAAVALAPLFIAGEVAERDGEVGVNIFVQEQQRMVLPPGTPITTPTDSVNMGFLPQETAVALGTRILLQRNDLPNRVTLRVPYIDLSLKKGVGVHAYGRDGDDLGTYIIEARSFGENEFDNGPRAYMNLQAREA